MSNWKADDGSLINYEIHGNRGETLLLLPGFLGAISSQWRKFAAPLSEHYRVVLVDLRGHGMSDNKSTELTAEQIVDDLFGIIDSLNVRNFHVAGYSLGGYLGLMMLFKQPRRMHSLLMHATKFYWTAEAVEKTKDQFDPDIMIEKVPTYANQLAEEHGGGRWRTLVRQSSDLIGQLSRSGISEREAARVQIPVLISVGDRDEMVSLPESLRLSRVFPQGGLFVLPNVRHPFSTLGLVPLMPMMMQFHRSPEGRR